MLVLVEHVLVNNLQVILLNLTLLCLVDLKSTHYIFWSHSVSLSLSLHAFKWENGTGFINYFKYFRLWLFL